MTYIGLSPPNTFTKSTSQTFTGNGSTTDFTLQTRVSSPEDLEVFVSNVQQQPTESYTIGSDGVTMTFSEAPPSGTFYVIYRTVAQQAGTDTGASRLGENNTFTGTQTFNADISFLDNVKAKFGTGNDLKIYHDGSNSYIQDEGTGGLLLLSSFFGIKNADGTEYLAHGEPDGAFYLYHNGISKLATTSAGVAVTGNVDMNGGEVILDADADTSITADTDDQIDIRVAGSDKVKIDATKFEISGTTANTQGGEFPRIQISTLADNNPTYSGALDIVEKQSSATSSAVFGENGLFGFRMMLDGFNNVLKWFSGSQTTVTERMGLDRETGNLTLNTGNLVIGTSGKGIDFSATGNSSGSMSSETFSDYEEGTFGISMTVATGTFQISSSYNLLSYTKIGQRVFISGGIRFAGANSGGSPSGAVHIDDLPFTPASASEDEIHSCFFVAHDTMTGLSSGGQAMIGQILPSNTNIFLFTQDQNGFADCGNHFTDNSILRFNFSYISA